MKTAMLLFSIAAVTAPVYAAGDPPAQPGTAVNARTAAPPIPGAKPATRTDETSLDVLVDAPAANPPVNGTAVPVPGKPVLLIQELDRDVFGLETVGPGEHGIVRRLEPAYRAAIRLRRQGYLGVLIGQFAAGPAANQNAGHGVSVEDVVAGGPAAAAGIQPGDIITSLSGKPINTPSALSTTVGELPAGKKVILNLLRKDRHLTIGVALGARPVPAPRLEPEIAVEQTPPSVRPVQFIHGGVYVSGRVLADNGPISDATVMAYDEGNPAADGSALAITSTLANGSYVLHLPGPGSYRLLIASGRSRMSKDLRVPPGGLQKADLTVPYPGRVAAQHLAYLGLMLRNPEIDKQGGLTGLALQGAAVEEVAPGGPSAAAGVHTSDLITALDGEAITDPGQLSASVRKLPIGKKVVLHVLRGGQTLDLPATLGQIVLPADDGEELPAAGAFAVEREGQIIIEGGDILALPGRNRLDEKIVNHSLMERGQQVIVAPKPR